MKLVLDVVYAGAVCFLIFLPGVIALGIGVVLALVLSLSIAWGSEPSKDIILAFIIYSLAGIFLVWLGYKLAIRRMLRDIFRSVGY